MTHREEGRQSNKPAPQAWTAEERYSPSDDAGVRGTHNSAAVAVPGKDLLIAGEVLEFPIAMGGGHEAREERGFLRQVVASTEEPHRSR